MMTSVTTLFFLWNLGALSGAYDDPNAPQRNNCTEWMASSVNLQCSTNDGICNIDGMLMDVCTKNTSSKVNIMMNRVPLVDIIFGNETKPYYCIFPAPATSEIPTTTTHKPGQVMTTQEINKGQLGKCITSTVLGAAVGLLVVVLIIVTTGWVWTCWTIKRRGGKFTITANSRNIR